MEQAPVVEQDGVAHRPAMMEGLRRLTGEVDERL